MSDTTKEMSADDLCKIFCKTRPELFNHMYKECKLLYEQNKTFDDSEQKYWDIEELIFAKAIISDYGDKFANKVGRIIVAATTGE